MQQQPPKKDKVIAALLAFFAGTWGIHRFYLGQIGTGIMHILFFWTFIPSIVSLVDAIGLITMQQEQFDRKYNPHLFQMSGYGMFNNQLTDFSVADEISKLDDLFRRGVITFEEFEKRKSRLLG